MQAQTHTFCASDLPCTNTANNIFTGSNTFGTTFAKIFEGTYSADQYCAVAGTLDQTCIQNAITAASGSLLGGGTVFIPAGTYTLTGSVTLASNVSLQCSQGWKSQINIVDDGTLAMRKFIGGVSGFGNAGITNVSISECSIRMTGVTGRTGVYGLISFFNSSNVALIHNQLGAPLETNTQLASSATCGYFENDNNVVVNFNTCDGTQADGFHFSRASTNGTVIGNKLKFTGDDSIAMVSVVTDDGVNNYNPVSFFTITGNTIEQNGGNTGGLSQNASGISCYGCTLSTVLANTIDSPAGPCIAITAITGNSNGNSTRYPFQDVVGDNSCRNSGAIGTINAALIMQFTRASRMHHNVVSVHSSDCAFIGAVGKDNIFDHNWISGCTGRDINAIQTSSTEARLITELWTNFNDGTPARVGISNLTVDHNTVSKPTVAAIEFTGEAALSETGILASDNQIYNPAANQIGIFATRVNNSQFNNNTCININNNGCIELSTGDSDLVNGGMMATGTGASSTGVLLLSMTNSVVENIFARNAGIGVFVDSGGSNNIVQNNDLRANSGGSRVIQDTTSVAIDNIEANFTGQRNQTRPDLAGVVVLDTAAQTLTNKTLTAPTLSGITNGTGDQLFNSATTCTTGATAGATCTTAAITLPVAYADTNYRVSCTGQTATNVPVVQTYTKSNTTFTITIAALTAAAATFTSYDCRVGHN